VSKKSSRDAWAEASSLDPDKHLLMIHKSIISRCLWPIVSIHLPDCLHFCLVLDSQAISLAVRLHGSDHITLRGIYSHSGKIPAKSAHIFYRQQLLSCRCILPDGRERTLGFRVQGSGFRVLPDGRERTLGFRVQGSGFRVLPDGREKTSLDRHAWENPIDV
jgi:hypothetical protein